MKRKRKRIEHVRVVHGNMTIVVYWDTPLDWIIWIERALA